MADLTSKRYLGEEGIKQIGKNIKGGNSLSGSTSYTVNDSVDYPLVRLKVYGKGTQDGTPTPENPVEIVSVVEPTVTVCGKNLLNATLQTTMQNGITCINNGNGTYTLNGTATADCAFELGRFHFEAGKTYRMVGCPPGGSWNNYAYNGYLSQNKLGVIAQELGKGSNFTPTKSDTLAMQIRFWSGKTANNLTFKPMITTDFTATYDDFEPYKPIQTSTIPDTLNAIPVSSGGNVTIDGQEYIADYVDFERGVKVQRVGREALSGGFTKGSAEDGSILFQYGIENIINSTDYYAVSKVMCDKYKSCHYGKIHSPNIAESDKSISDWYKRIVIKDTDYTSVEDFNTYLATNPIEILYTLATPIETPLSETEMQAYRQLQTYNGVTNISNDKGAGLEVSYCTSKMLAEYALPLIKDLEAENVKKDEEISVLKTDILNNEKIHNRIYEGVNLSEKFASEIAASPYNGNPWAWIKARISAEDFTGIHVGDYIPFTTTNGVTLNAQIAGINTYKNYGDTPVGAHIDFICKELWGTLHPINKVNYNNGITNQNHPWLASDLYLYLNSLSGSVPNGTAVNPETIEVDYTTDGVYYYLPEALKSVIKEKRFLAPKRYSASGLLTDDNQWGWTNIGKLWLPDECEVYGTPIWGGKGFSAGGSGLQYPLFAGNMNRLKLRNGSHYYWWLLSPYSGNSSPWCYVDIGGNCSHGSASNGSIAAPVCFRV